MRHEFQVPDWNAPLATKERIARIPSEVSVRGVFFNFVADELRKGGHNEPQRIPFKLYPMSELMAMQVRAAVLLYPDQPLREGLRRLGRLGYTSLISTTSGKILFSVAGIDFRIAVSLASKAYALSQTNSRCDVLDLEKNWARLRLSNLPNFPECSQVGVFEGAMLAYRVAGTVLLKQLADDSAEYLLEWK